MVSIQCTVHSVQYSVYIGQFTVYSVQWSVYIAQCTVYSVPCLVYITNFTVYIAQFTVVIVQCKVYTAPTGTGPGWPESLWTLSWPSGRRWRGLLAFWQQPRTKVEASWWWESHIPNSVQVEGKAGGQGSFLYTARKASDGNFQHTAPLPGNFLVQILLKVQILKSPKKIRMCHITPWNVNFITWSTLKQCQGNQCQTLWVNLKDQFYDSVILWLI